MPQQSNTILLTGATGFLGGQILKALLLEGYKVVIIIRKTSSIKRISNYLSAVNVYYLEETSVDEIIQKHHVKTIINTAASYGRNNEALTEIVNANLIFPLSLLDAALTNNVSCFINTATSLPENVNAYSLSKKQFVQWLKTKSAKLCVVNMIPEYFYGPGDDEWKLISMMLTKLLKNENEIQFTDGLQERDFIFIEDVVKAYMLILKKINTSNGFFEYAIASETTVSIKLLAQLCKQLSNNTATQLAFGAIPNRPNDVQLSASNSNALKKLGWSATTSLEKGLQLTIQTLKHQLNTIQ